MTVHAEESRQMGTGDAGVSILQKALTDYRAQAASKLTASPF